MLSRTADHLFWMSRYMERAENLARLLDVTYQMSLVPQSEEAANQSWSAIIALNSLEEAYAAQYSVVNGENVLKFMVSDAGNVSSIHSCLRMARENAHAVRGTLTTEMWETLNYTWLEARGRSFEQLLSAGISEYFEWVKMRSSLTRGTTLGTLLQDEAYHFIRLGTLLERADNTARILTVKYQVIREDEDSVREFYRWNALLRSVGAYEAHQTLYKTLSHASIAELLILRNEVPRSLRACLDEMELILAQIEGNAGQTPRRLTTILNAHLTYGAIDDVFALGMQEYLSDFLSDIGAIGQSIHAAYLEVL